MSQQIEIRNVPQSVAQDTRALIVNPNGPNPVRIDAGTSATFLADEPLTVTLAPLQASTEVPAP